MATTIPKRLRVVRFLANAPAPKRGTGKSSGLDLAMVQWRYVSDGADAWRDDEAILDPGESIMVATGIKVGIPDGYEGQVRPRSSMFKRGFRVPLGTIDADYTGHVLVGVQNVGSERETIRVGERVAQLVIAPVELVSVVEVESLDVTERGDGGFGSTGR